MITVSTVEVDLGEKVRYTQTVAYDGKVLFTFTVRGLKEYTSPWFETGMSLVAMCKTLKTAGYFDEDITFADEE